MRLIQYYITKVVALTSLLALASPGLTSLRAADVTWDGSGEMTWTQPDSTSWSGATYESGDTALFTGSGQGTVTLSGTITPGSVTVSAGAYTFGGTAIGGVGGLTVSGGTSTLNNAANTYSGNTVVGAAGTLQMNQHNRLPFGVGKGNVTVDGTLVMNTVNLTVNGLTGAGNVVLWGNGWSSQTLTLGDADASSTFDGVIQFTVGTLHVTKTGDGTVTLSGNNVYSGVTTVNAGTLAMSGANTLIRTVTVSNGATLKLSHANALDGAPTLTLSGGATLDVTNMAYTLGNSQELRLSGNGATATLATDAGAGLALGATGPMYFSAYDGVTPPLTVSGAGGLTLSSGNTVTVMVAGTNSLAVGDYTLIEDGVAGDAPTTYVNVGGAGRAAATTAELLIAGGNLVLRIADYSPVHAPTSIATAAAGPWDWPGTWEGSIVPGPGDSVTVNHAVSLWCGTHELASFVNNTTLTFNGWNAPLRAGEVTINGTMTHPAQSATASDPITGEWVPDNRVLIECENLTLNASKTIDTYRKGYGTALGPGGGIGSVYPGGAYGGYGQNNTNTYGSAEAPVEPGSGGGGSVGGGVVRITATGTITVYGTVTANGGPPSIVAGCGSGGSVLLECHTLAGDGVVSANGGSSANTYCGGGGGGRIAVSYDPTAQDALPLPTITFDANGGRGGDLGTLHFSDNQFLSSPMRHSGQWMVPGTTNWSCDQLVFTNASLRFSEPGFTLSVAGDWTMTGADDYRKYGLQVTNSEITCGGSVSMTGCTLTMSTDGDTIPSLTAGGDLTLQKGSNMASVLYLYAAKTNGGTRNCGLPVTVGGTFTIGTNCTVYPDSHGTNGGSVFFSVGSLFLAAGGLIDANVRGYDGRKGPGFSGDQAGGSYGGRGAGESKAPYGYEEWPQDPGSGGRFSDTRGGGLVVIEAANRMTINGTIRTTGADGGAWTSAASGGGVALKCKRLIGNGTITAIGGTSVHWWCIGAGGRIAIWRMYDNTTGLADNVAATRGGAPGEYAEDGTVFWGLLPIPGLRVIFR